MSYGGQLLSKILDTNDPGALTRFAISEEHFSEPSDRAAYRFIRDYAESNRNQAPDYRTVSAEVEGFTYVPEVGDSLEWLADNLKKAFELQEYYGFFAKGEFERVFNSGDPEAIEKSLAEFIEKVRTKSNRRSKIGRTLADMSETFRAEYNRRAAGKSFKLYQTPFPTLNDEIGGLFTGDIYGIIAESGRGKTYLQLVIIDELLRQGANVLVKSFEVKEYVWMSRLISIITAVEGLLVSDDSPHPLGIPNKALLSGKLDEYIRENLDELLSRLDSYYPGTLIFQGKSDPLLTRSLDDLERELEANPSIDVVVLDPFYGLSDVYGKNVNKTAGGAAEYAATRLENIIGAYDVVGLYSVQATVESKQKDEEGRRELRLPTREHVKTSKRLLDIATNLISFDSNEKEGIAKLGLEKGRNGGEDFELELVALFDYGVLKELPSGEAMANQFVSQF